MLGNKGSETPESGKIKKKNKNLLISDFFDRKEKKQLQSWKLRIYLSFFFIDWYIFIFKSFICHSQALLFPSSI